MDIHPVVKYSSNVGQFIDIGKEDTLVVRSKLPVT